MPQIIAGTYEILREIGFGGGGTVYLARHLRLDKNVVLKANRQKVKVKPELLRREVDALKNLSHQYIPQVYDFIVEDDIIYTVVDYIDGESFDKHLANGTRFTQSQIINWACQLLEALSYLHSRPPHGILHADIKPANIILTPQGDICLIDFNIALALGEEGATAAGHSLGYASPEHFASGVTPSGDVAWMNVSNGAGVNVAASAVAASAAAASAAAAGQSFEYASAEIYGNGIAPSGDTARLNMRNDMGATTVVEFDDLTPLPQDFSPSPPASRLTSPPVPPPAPPPEPTPQNSATPGKRTIIDVRSDIYGLGATLYHILTSTRPAHNIGEVIPLDGKEYGANLAAIINKAMNPNPDRRFQTADEMLSAFRQLRENDPRTIHRKRLRRVICAAIIFMFIAIAITAFVGVKRAEAEQRAIAEQERAEAENQREEAEWQRAEAEARREEAERQRIEAEKRRAEAELLEAHALAAKSAEALRGGDKRGAIEYALSAFPKEDSVNKICIPEARRALADALGIYNLLDGYKPYITLMLDSDVIKTAISPGGFLSAAMTLGELTVFRSDSADVVATLPTAPSALSDAAFLDDDTIVYAGADGLRTYRISDNAAIWKGDIATTITVSADKKTIAAVNRDDETAAVYTSEGKYRTEVPLNGKHLRVAANDRLIDPRDNLFALNADGTLLAASFSDGSLAIMNINNRERDIKILDASAYTHFEGGFCDRYFAFSATNSVESLFAIIDIVDHIETVSATLPAHIGIHADESGIYMSYNSTHVKIDPLAAKQTPLAAAPADVEAGGYQLMSSPDSPVVHILRYEDHSSEEVIRYDAGYPHDEARLSTDGMSAMLYNIHGFRIYGFDGSLVCGVRLDNPAAIYDQQYRRVGGASYLDVTYYDGTVTRYSGSDGTMIAETRGEIPDKSLYEEYIADEIKITSPLHGTPVAYNLKTGEKVRELEKDAYLTYVTQAGEYIITEYISVVDGSRYGLLLDGKNCETLAYLPNLCDIIGTRLIFDTRTGSLRESRIYTTDEMIAMGAEWLRHCEERSDATIQ